ncbi:hypothetical protein LIER_38788 [Lithospermum erythrorhizon]|uniref:Uncharacterized protein n=1 Tax=Lithospermum erythrorhizon TaxID=34254 RepID=A0AAV3Q4S4_LITER
MLAYGIGIDACDKNVKIRESMALECLEIFCEGIIIAIFETTYLRRPNEADLQRLLPVGKKCGFPKKIGSIY